MTIIVFILAFILIPIGYADALSDFTFTISNIQNTSTITTNGAKVTYVVTSQNNRIDVSNISCDPTSGSLFPLGNTPIICTATDNQGNTSTASFIITVGDTDSTAPTYPIIHMQDTTASSGLSTYSGRQIHAEYVSSTSQLVGDKIDTITLRLARTGSPTGFAQIGVFNTDLSVKKLFGTKDASTISTSYTDYTFALGPTDLYTIQSGDRIGIKYTGGSSNANVKIMSDGNTADPFDGKNTYRIYYTTSWNLRTTEDLTITLKQTHAPADTSPPTTTATPPGGTYTSAQSVVLSANEAATIYYTTDGSTPTTSSPTYSGPIPISTTTTLNFFAKDLAGNGESPKTQVYTIAVTYPLIHMQDTTATGGYSTYSGRQIHAEYVSVSSQLVGDKIDTITLRLARTGSPTGFAQIGVFNTDLSVKKLFGTKDVATISTSYTDYTFALGPTDLYTIQSGDRIGIKYTGGDSANIIKTNTDGDISDPFDGTKTYRVYYTTSWVSTLTSEDLYMVLTQTHQ
jgi:hypothetical protein